MRIIAVFALLSIVGCSPPPATNAAQVFGPAKITLDTLTEEKARELNGRQVVASMTVATPYFAFEGTTIVGPVEQPDGINRTLVLNGERPELTECKKIAVTGRLWIIDHPQSRVGATLVPAWREIRVVEDQPRNP